MPPAPDRLTRAAILRSSAAILGAALLEGAAPASAAPASDEEEAVVVLEGLVARERTLADAYGAAASLGVLRDLAGEGPGHVRDQELRHEEELLAALERLGAEPLEPPADRPALDPSTGERGIAELLLDLESATVAAYLEALYSLRGGRLIETLTQIMASDGQHLALLRLAVNRTPVPRAFETGERGGIAPAT